MDNLKPNSERFKDESSEPAKKLIDGDVQARPRGMQSRLRSDAPQMAKRMKDILVPSLKDLVESMLKTAIDMILYPDGTSPRYSNNRYSDRGRTSYESIYKRPDTRSESYSSRMEDYEDLTFRNRPEADIVLNQLRADINEYGCVSVARYYDYAGYSNENFALRNWGWFDLNSARPYMTRSGRWALDLPRIQSLK